MQEVSKITRPPIVRTSARPSRVLQRKPVQPAVQSVPEVVQSVSQPPTTTPQPSPATVESTKQQLDDQLKKGILFFKLIFKNKRLKNLSLGFSTIRNSIIIKNNNVKVLFLKLHKLSVTKKMEGVTTAFRRLATNAAKNRRGYLRNKSVVLEQQKLKVLNRLLELLEEKYLERIRQPMEVLIEKKRLMDKMKFLNRSAKLKFFNVLVRQRYRQGLHKLKMCAASKSRSKLSYLRNTMSIISKKTTTNLLLGFEFIKRVAMYKKAQALKQQQVDKRNVSDREQKLMEQVDQLAAENAEIKKKYDGDLGELQGRKQELLKRLEELVQKNAQVNARIEELQAVKKNQVVSFGMMDVYERVYQNFLYFLKYAEEEIPKADLLNSLSTPMCRIDMPIDTIREENQALTEVIEQYKRLNLKLPPQPFKEQPLIIRPYEQLLRENSELYSVLGALIQNSVASQNDKEYLKIVSEFSNLEDELVKVRVDLDGK